MTRLATRALFLDRDGVINVNHGYVGKINDFEFIPGIFELCRAAQRKGYKLFIVTNQSGIARGYYNKEDFLTLSHWMVQRFSEHGIRIDQIAYCPHHPNLKRGISQFCLCRKPKPQMITRLARSFGIDKRKSLMVGDSLSDIRAAKKAGIGKAVLITQRPGLTNPQLEAPAKKPYYRAQSLYAVRGLL